MDGGRDLGRPPCFLPDNRLERAQNLPDLWKTYGDEEFEVTELLDGIPVIVYQVNKRWQYKALPGMLVDDNTGLFRKRSKTGISIGNHDYEETENSSSWAALRSQGVIGALRECTYDQGIVLSGVLCGVGISGNPHGISGRQFYVHSVSEPPCTYRFSINGSESAQYRLKQTFELVPTFSRRIRLSAFAENIDELMMKAAGDSFVFNHERRPPKRKGLVFRALDGSLNFKAMSNTWLLDETEKLRNMDEDARCRPGPNDAS